MGCEYHKKVKKILQQIAEEHGYYYSLGEKFDNAAKVKNMVYDDYSDLKLAKKAFAKACQYNYKDSCKRKEAIEKSMQYLGDANVKKLKNRIKKLKEEGLDDLTIAIKLAKEDYLYWAQMRYGKYGYEIQKEHLQSIKKSGMPEIYSRCMACHGKKGDKKALGRSKKINKLSKEDFIKAIRGYQNGTYGGALKGIMIGQVQDLSSTDIKSISRYLKLKSTKHQTSKKTVHHEKSKVLKSSGGKIAANQKSKYLEQIQSAIKADNKSEKKSKAKKAKHVKQRIEKKKKVEVKRKAGIFYDKATGLIWQDNKDAKTIKKDWDGAKEYCKNLDLGGYSDWRLPTKDELASIIDKTNTPTIKTGFKNVSSSDYWSSSQVSWKVSKAWEMDFSSGYTHYYSNKSNKHFVRCVVNKIHWWED